MAEWTWDQAARDLAVTELRALAIKRHPDPQERKRLWIAAFEDDVAKNRPGIPGAAFIANPGLAEYLLECFKRWEPTE